MEFEINTQALDAAAAQAVNTMRINIVSTAHEFTLSAPAMAAAILNGGTLTCISCGAKTNERGALPCGH